MSGRIQKLNEDDALLVVIDMQEKLVRAMDDEAGLTARAEKLVKGFTAIGLPVLFTQQYTKGLGGTIEEIKNADFSFVEKLSYSVMGAPEFSGLLASAGRKQLVVCGIEAHVCVQQSVLDFLEAGYEAFVAADATASRNPRDKRTALRRMSGAGAVITTMESVLFELLGTAEHPKFKAISNIVK